MAGLAKSATLEGPFRSGPTDKYRVLRTKNTLEIRPGQMLTEKNVSDLIRVSRLDLTIVAPKKK